MNYTKSHNDTVSQYLSDLPPETQDLFISIREVILKTNHSLQESIKWKDCLVYSTGKNIIQTVAGKNKVSLIFFDGVKINDKYGLLEGDGKKTRTLRIVSRDFNLTALKDFVIQATEIAGGE